MWPSETFCPSWRFVKRKPNKYIKVSNFVCLFVIIKCSYSNPLWHRLTLFFSLAFSLFFFFFIFFNLFFFFLFFSLYFFFIVFYFFPSNNYWFFSPLTPLISYLILLFINSVLQSNLLLQSNNILSWNFYTNPKASPIKPYVTFSRTLSNLWKY